MEILPEVYRIDPLTGCHNFLSYVEALDQLLQSEPRAPMSILYTDLNHLDLLNKTKGHLYGDSVIRWMGIVLMEETNESTYRYGGDDFTVIFTSGTFEDHKAILDRIQHRLEKEAPLFDIPSPAAALALIHYSSESEWKTSDVLMHMAWQMSKLKMARNNSSVILVAQNLVTDSKMEAEFVLQSFDWTTQRLLQKIILMGQVLDVAQQAAFTDSTSGLPNMRAAEKELEKAINYSKLSGNPFSFLLMDGDNLRLYNTINYAAGDEMIRNVSKLLLENVRPGDFVARWRTGDEFVAILPGTPVDGAKVVAERARLAVHEASKAWLFPSSISIGIASYPLHADNADSLIDKAETAMKSAKDAGKNRSVLAQA